MEAKLDDTDIFEDWEDDTLSLDTRLHLFLGRTRSGSNAAILFILANELDADDAFDKRRSTIEEQGIMLAGNAFRNELLHVMSGAEIYMRWQGEPPSDTAILMAINNKLHTSNGHGMPDTVLEEE